MKVLVEYRVSGLPSFFEERYRSKLPKPGDVIDQHVEGHLVRLVCKEPLGGSVYNTERQIDQYIFRCERF